MSDSMELTENQKACLRMETMMAVLERARDLELAKSWPQYTSGFGSVLSEDFQGAHDTYEAGANDAQATSHCLCAGAPHGDSGPSHDKTRHEKEELGQSIPDQEGGGSPEALG